MIFISTSTVTCINCTVDTENVIKNLCSGLAFFTYPLHFESDPYLLVDTCALFLMTNETDESYDDFVPLADSQQGMQLLRNFIFELAEVPRSIIEQKLREFNKPKEGLKLSLAIPNSADMKLLNEGKKHEEKFEIFIENESTCEESIRQCHEYNKTWEGTGHELYKVTEDDESLEFSDEPSDLFVKLTDFSAQIANSISDKFPKLSIASLSISDTSFQNAYDAYKRSYLDYIEPLEIVTFPSPERTEEDCCDIQVVSTNALTFSDDQGFKPILEAKSETCACPQCGIF